MATGYYILGGVSVATGASLLTATTYQVPGAAADPVNFANLVGASGAEGTPAGFTIVGPAGQVAIARHAVNATTLQLAEPWAGAPIAAGACMLVLGINALPIGRLATLITQIVAQRPLLKTNNLSEFAGQPAAQGEIQTNIGISAFIKTLLDDADAAAARATLLLGDMATQSQSAYVPKVGGTFTGTVAIPNQPAMIATRNNNIYETLGANTQHGLLGAFSLNRGGFTQGGNVAGALVVHVPVTGVYLVMLRAYVQGGSSGRLYVSRNGTNTGLFIQTDNGAVDRSLDATGLLSLTAGDYLAYGVGASALTLYTASGHTEVRAAFLG